ncbi:MAG: helix-turn-helix domain-containing protein [Solirubrobacterales bacterium]
MTVAGQLGLNLTAMRRGSRLTQDPMVRRTGLRHTEISSLECGQGIPCLDTAFRIVQTTDAVPGDLFEDVSWREPARPDEEDRFTIAGLDEPANLRPIRRGEVEELGLTIGGLSERSWIGTVVRVAVLLGLKEMGVVEWAGLSKAFDVSLDWMLEGIRFVPRSEVAGKGFHRVEPDPRGSAGDVDTPDRPKDRDGGDPR